MKNWIKNNRGFIIFMLCLGLLRTAVADWNPIPSGSMRPNLLEGDVVLVNRLAYDLKLPLTDTVLVHLGEPQRSDIVTFSSPADGARLIKRLIAVPGDVVEMRNEVLWINGQVADYGDAEAVLEPTEQGGAIAATRLTEKLGNTQRRVQLLSGVKARSSFGPLTVPADHYLVLGDNRDNSADSRYIGFMPRRLLIGHAHRVLLSADIKGHWAPRFERFWRSLS